MFRIRRIYDDVVPVNQKAISQVQRTLRARFPGVLEDDVVSLGKKLRNPFKQRLRTVLFVGEDVQRRVKGFAILLHEPEIGFCFLDFIAAGKGLSGRGIGGALYSHVRTEASRFRARGLFFECLPDDESACPDPKVRAENAARLKFYERYGAFPIVGTDYERPIGDDTCMPHLVYDGLDRVKPPRRQFVKRVIRALLERKYPRLCTPEYVDAVVASVTDDPVRLRSPRYLKARAIARRIEPRLEEPIALIVNEGHEIHHVRERGYVESPVRLKRIMAELAATGAFERIEPHHAPDRALLEVHDADYVEYLRRACDSLDAEASLYPYIFPIRNKARPPTETSVLSGYYCIDTFTPLSRSAYAAARGAADCAYTGAKELLSGRRLAYALVRPPGHHAERGVFGGFCYLNNGAIAAQTLSHAGRVAILDLDYHHGNGQQDVFFRRADVLTVSIHGDPSFAYPYFSGFEDERGEGPGEGFNVNIPLPEECDGERYRIHLLRALRRVEVFAPVFLVVSLGLDTARGDPTGTWSLTGADLELNGRLVGELGLPTLVVQEGGYRTRNLGTNARRFLSGLARGARNGGRRPLRLVQREDLAPRDEPVDADIERVRALVSSTGFFSEPEVSLACELVSERLEKGEASGYLFLLVEIEGSLVGYTCFGPVPCTRSSWDLYWIAISPSLQGRGLGRFLLTETERRISERGGTRLYAETSGRPSYTQTRVFYERTGFEVASTLDDFYAPGDDKVTFLKRL